MQARLALTLPLVVLLTGCGVGERLGRVGKAPDLQPIENPTQRPDYRPVSLPMPPPEPNRSAGANSLWREGARGFFRDQRARRVGDVLTVNIVVKDQAALNNETSRSRATEDSLGLPNLLGLEGKLVDFLPNGASADKLVGANSDMRNKGSGATQRSESVNTNVAAVIVQQLPNGNLVIEGRQEIRVNFEVREVYVAGIVRPEDITPANTISHEKIAELRVAYGGRGLITDVQQPRYGSQVLDILLPY